MRRYGACNILGRAFDRSFSSVNMSCHLTVRGVVLLIFDIWSAEVPVVVVAFDAGFHHIVSIWCHFLLR